MTDSEEKRKVGIPASESIFFRFARFVRRHPILTGIVAAIAAAWAAAELYGDFPRPALGIVLLGAGAFCLLLSGGILLGAAALLRQDVRLLAGKMRRRAGRG